MIDRNKVFTQFQPYFLFTFSSPSFWHTQRAYAPIYSNPHHPFSPVKSITEFDCKWMALDVQIMTQHCLQGNFLWAQDISFSLPSAAMWNGKDGYRAGSMYKKLGIFITVGIQITQIDVKRDRITSSDHSSWLQIQRSGFDSQGYQIFWEVVGLERGPLSLLTTTEELTEWYV
jgi:hypothetical protein